MSPLMAQWVRNTVGVVVGVTMAAWLLATSVGAVGVCRSGALYCIDAEGFGHFQGIIADPGPSSISGMTLTAPLLIGDGTSGAPAYSFTNAPTLGLYNAGSSVLGIAGNTIWGGASHQLVGKFATYNNAAITDGQLLIGNTATSRFDAATLTAGQGISITNSGGGVTIANTGAPAGVVQFYAGSSAPPTWSFCDGAEVNRTGTYAGIFTAIGTTYGAGNGSTTFNLPNATSRTIVVFGTGSTVEITTTSSANGFVVASNTAKWITGMPIVLSAFSGFTSSATAGPTYYVVRVSATNVRLATTLALAQTGAPDVTLSGTGSATLTYTLPSRAVGEIGGEVAHAQSSTELLSHTHSIPLVAGTADGGTSNGPNQAGSTLVTGATGGNAAMNIMPPFLVLNCIIKQ